MSKQSVLGLHAFFHVIPRHLRNSGWLLCKRLLRVFKEAAAEWNQDNGARLSAALAFYILLSLAPVLVVFIAVLALVYGKEAARGQLVGKIQGLAGRSAAAAIQEVVKSARQPGTGTVATLLGVVTVALGASSVVVELRDALNTIWHVHRDCGNRGLARITRLLTKRFFSFTMMVGAGVLLLVSLVLDAWIAAMEKLLGSFLPTPEPVLHLATFLISFLVITCLFAAIYKLLPDTRLEWRDVAVGAPVTSLIFTAGKQVVGLYLGKASLESSYGAAGSLVILLVWVYYSAQLFFFGAEFTKVYANTFGSHSGGRAEK
ncbi:MAG TPA: YihY/virulence factor BrkB family protein [Candidatus Limnocylindrales bacterium]|nr:YihY/virulence factor BrkB family protein [Candidatus Limnocylindrales bacterium]